MYNKKVLNKATANLDKAKAPVKKADIITDPMGQWKYPGQNTRIPGGNITMEGVPYPVMAQPNVGQPQMMYPGQDYQFPGADYVDEYPMARKGGALPKLPKKKNSKGYSRSLTATNKLFAQNPLTKKNKSKKNKVFDPQSKYFAQGGDIPELPLNTNRQLLRDWVYGADIGMLQEANGGYIDAELTPEEIDWYRSQGYQIEDID